MENTVVKDVVLDKKLSSYNVNTNDFVAQGELTVEITLQEYRHLIKECAIAQHKIDEANKDRYEREQEIKALKEKNAELKAENYELNRSIDECKLMLYSAERGNHDE